MSPIRTRFGYYTIHPVPTKKELNDFYNNCPLGSGTPYTHEIDADEFYHREIACQECDFLLPKNIKTMLDVGCGEGFFLNYFNKKGLTVHGLDFNDSLIKHHFPHLATCVTKGDLLENLKVFYLEGKKWDFVNLTNVLEHVYDPVECLSLLKQIVSDEHGFVRITVPNDYSKLQLEAVNRGYARNDFWIAPPAHLNYFNTSNIVNFLADHGFKVNRLLGEFPIEFYLFNRRSNYQANKDIGYLSHKARIEIENLIAKNSILDLIAFREGCARAGLGRNITAYCSLNRNAER